MPSANTHAATRASKLLRTQPNRLQCVGMGKANRLEKQKSKLAAATPPFHRRGEKKTRRSTLNSRRHLISTQDMLPLCMYCIF